MNDDICKLLITSSLFGNEYGDTFNDIMFCLNNDDIMDIRLSLTFEVIELYEDLEYSYDEIVKMIDSLTFEGEKLSDSEKEYLKCDAKKVLDIRYNKNNNLKKKLKKENDKYE